MFKGIYIVSKEGATYGECNAFAVVASSLEQALRYNPFGELDKPSEWRNKKGDTPVAKLIGYALDTQEVGTILISDWNGD